jgi:RNA recognition motif-containing protein
MGKSGKQEAPALALRLAGLPRPLQHSARLATLFGRIGPLRRCLVERKTGDAYVEYWFARDAEQARKQYQQQRLEDLVLDLDDWDDVLRAALRRPRFRLECMPAQEGKDPFSKKECPVAPGKRPVQGSLPKRTVRVWPRASSWSADLESRFQQVLSQYGRAVWTGSHEEPSATSPSGYALRERELVLPSWVDARNVCGLLHDLVVEPSVPEKQHGLCARIVGMPTTKCCRVIVRNLPFTFQEQELLALLRTCGPLAAVNIPPRTPVATEQTHRGHFAGYAFVEYFVKADAHAAVQRLNGKTFHGRILAVDRAVCRERYHGHQTEQPATTDDHETSRVKPKAVAHLSADRSMPGMELDGQVRKRSRNELSSDVFARGSSAHSLTAVNKEHQIQQSQGPGTDQAPADAPDAAKASIGSSLSVEVADQAARLAGNKPGAADAEALRARTLFVRQVPLDATAAELEALLEPYGRIKYCLLVRDPLTGLARGSAFVCFQERAAAERVMRDAAPAHSSKSPMPLSLEQAPLQLHGRALHFCWALSRTEAAQVHQQRMNAAALERHDRRNLYLALEGVIEQNHPAAAGLSAAELALRTKLEQSKRQKLLRNPHTVVSRTLLTVHNLPRSLNERQIKTLFAQAGRVSETGKAATIKQVRIAHERHGKQRACAYAFVEFAEHAAALTALRNLNNNPDALPAPHQGRRLVVQFAIEDERKVRLHTERRQQRVAEKRAKTVGKDRLVHPRPRGVNSPSY